MAKWNKNKDEAFAHKLYGVFKRSYLKDGVKVEVWARVCLRPYEFVGYYKTFGEATKI